VKRQFDGIERELHDIDVDIEVKTMRFEEKRKKNFFLRIQALKMSDKLDIEFGIL